MKKCGLLGERLSHSYSPQIHGMLGGYEYRLFEKTPDEAEDFIRHGDFDAVNVTIPYKKTAFRLCDRLSDSAKRLGNVNTLIKNPDGTLFGHNTDFYGFSYTVNSSGIKVAGKKAIVLGSGGASATVCAVLRDLGAAGVTVISRGGENSYDNLNRHFDAEIIVNATPVGMYPNNGGRLIRLEDFEKCCGVFDLIYNPDKTALLLDAERLGIPFSNGLTMLVAQAKESAEYFGGGKIEDSVIKSVVRKLSAGMKNIILIGMPGCGKSSVGRAAAALSGREFIDADEYISAKESTPVPELLRKFGEDKFRRIESDALSEICKKSSCVIATGGGCVTRPENYPILHQNGIIVRLMRDIDLLPTDGRPLSSGTNLHDMYARRRPMYERFADFTVDNGQDIDAAAKKILECAYENCSY